MPDVGRRNRRRHVDCSTWPGTLCGAVSPTQVVEVGQDEVGVAGGEPLERGVEHVGRLVADRVPDGLGEASRYAYTAPVASPSKAAANAGMSWVRMPATARLGIGSSGRAPWWYRLNCSS